MKSVVQLDGNEQFRIEVRLPLETYCHNAVIVERTLVLTGTIVVAKVIAQFTHEINGLVPCSNKHVLIGTDSAGQTITSSDNEYQKWPQQFPKR